VRSAGSRYFWLSVPVGAPSTKLLARLIAWYEKLWPPLIAVKQVPKASTSSAKPPA
jgi:hypothetical protein